MNFEALYYKTANLLNLTLEQELEKANIGPIVEPDEETSAKVSPEISQLDKEEENSQKVIWVEKIIKLLTLLNRKDKSVNDLISSLTGDTNASNLESKITTIDNLLSTINPSPST